MFVITLTSKRTFIPLEGEFQSRVILHIAGDGIEGAAEINQMVLQLNHIKTLLPLDGDLV